VNACKRIHTTFFFVVKRFLTQRFLKNLINWGFVNVMKNGYIASRSSVFRGDNGQNKSALLSWLVVGKMLFGLLFSDLPGNMGLQQARAVGGNSGSFTHTSVADFTNACTVMSGAVPNPSFESTVTTNTGGGEVTTRATIEDDFDGAAVDPSIWVSGYVYDWYQVGLSVSGGVLTLDGAYLLSQQNFQSIAPRFFEARAIAAVNPPGVPGWPDLGFYRASPPSPPAEINPITPDTAIRLFVVPDNGAIFARGRDGDESAPLIDSPLSAMDLTVYHNYRIEWDQSETRFYVDGALRATIPGINTMNTYVFLYHQDPSTLQNRAVLQVDWVRAGQYPASGVYTSCIQDAGGMVNFTTMNVDSSVPSGSGLVVETRTLGDQVGAQWSAWAALNGSQIASPSGRYLQYRLNYTSASRMSSAEVRSVGVNYYGPTVMVVTPNNVQLDPGVQQQFTAEARDVNGRAVTGLDYTWSVESGGGTINQSGLFTAVLTAGTYTNTVRVTTPMVGGGLLTGQATVVVRDLPPVVETGGPYSGPEGSTIQLSMTATDPNGGLVSGYAWDLDNNGVYETPGQTAQIQRNDDMVLTVRARAQDAGGNVGMTTTTVTFTNVAPTINSVTANPPTVNEGSNTTITVSASDPGLDDVLAYQFDCDGNGSYEVGPQAGNSTACQMPDDGQRTVNVRVTDGDGGEDTDSVVVTVNNVAPTIVSVTNNGPVGEGTSATISVTATDPGVLDVLQYEFDCLGDGNYEVGPQAGSSTGCLYRNNGSYTVNVRVTDGDGGEDTDSTTVVVTNVPPVIGSVTNNGPVEEGTGATITVNASDQGPDDVLSYQFDCNNDGQYEVGPQLGNSAVCTFVNQGSYPVNVRVTDGDGGEDTDSTTVVVTNVPPTIVSVTNNGPKMPDYPVTVTVIATDPGVNDVLVYEFDCDNDGAYELTGSANTAACTFTAVGAYTVPVRVSDDVSSTTGATEVIIVRWLLYLPFNASPNQAP
jgi:hypothetical protein